MLYVQDRWALREVERLRRIEGGNPFRRELGFLFRLHVEASGKDHHLENSLPKKAFTLPQVVWAPSPAAGPPLSAPVSFAALSFALRRPA
jgi:hypothetical protein